NHSHTVFSAELTHVAPVKLQTKLAAYCSSYHVLPSMACLSSAVPLGNRKHVEVICS
ncbi:Uncharacterized protein DAT39_019709, partial [Clarias magur]